MTLPGSPSHGLQGEDWQAQRIRGLEAMVRALTTARSLQAATIDAGTLTIDPGGTFQLTGENGKAVFLAGAATGADKPDGAPQSVVIMVRDTGEIAFYLGDIQPLDGAYQQAWQWYDRSAHVVLAEDTNSGYGLAVPYLPIGQWCDYPLPPTSRTSATDWTTLQICAGYRHHPIVFGSVYVATDAGTTGDVRIVTLNGDGIGAVHSTAAGTSELASFGPIAPPVSSTAFPEPVEYQIQARVTGGTGSIGVRGMAMVGIQS